jgi:hypothetical protein
MLNERNFDPLKVMRYYACYLRILALKNFTFFHTLFVFNRDSENNQMTESCYAFPKLSCAASCKMYIRDTFFGGKADGAC